MNKKLKAHINNTIIFLALFSFVLGFYGWYLYFEMYSKEFSISMGMFLSLQLFTINTSFEHVVLPLPLEIARFLSPASLASAVLNAFFMFFYRRYILSAIKYRFRNHYIFNGLNVFSKRLIEDIMQDKHSQVAVLEKDERNLSSIDLHGRRVKILIDDPTGPGGLTSAGITNASYFMAMSEDDMENMAFVSKAISLLDNKKTQHAFIKLNNTDNLMLFSDFESDDLKLDIHAFNFHRKCAAYVVDDFAPDKFFAIKPNFSRQMQVMLVGFNDASAHILTEAVQMYHFANLKKTRFIITDHSIEEKYRSWFLRYPMAEHAADIEPVELEECIRGEHSVNFSDVGVIFVCCDNDALTTNMALRFRQMAYQQTRSLEQPVIVAIHWQSQLLSSLVSGIDQVFINTHIKLVNYLQYFSKTSFIEDKQKYDTIAKYIDAYYAEKYEYGGRQLSAEEIEARWLMLPDRMKESNRLPARHYHYKLRVLNACLSENGKSTDEELTIDDINAISWQLLARMEKNRWNAEKYIQGFVPGEYHQDKKLEKRLKNCMKYHPALKSWDEIPESEKEKDYESIRNITAIMGRAGYKVVKDLPGK